MMLLKYYTHDLFISLFSYVLFLFCFWFFVLRFVLRTRTRYYHLSLVRSPQSTPCQRVSSTGDGGRKPPCPPPPPPPSALSTDASLIHRSPNGGYVSLLRRTTVAKAEDLHGVRFNSLQRPSNRGDRPFRSMRTATVARDRDRDRNNNRGWPPDDDKNNGTAVRTAADAENRVGGGGEKIGGKRVGPVGLSATASFPKPAPRTRVPSATVAPPSLAHSDNYENLQQLMNSDSDTGKEVCVPAPTFCRP